MKKICVILCCLFILVSCHGDNQKQEKQPPEVTMIQTEPFEEGQVITISDLIQGTYDYATLLTPIPTTVGTHLIKIKVTRNEISIEVEAKVVIEEKLKIDVESVVNVEVGQQIDLSQYIKGNYETLEANIKDLAIGHHDINVTVYKGSQSAKIILHVIVNEPIEKYGDLYLQHPNSKITNVREDGLTLVNKDWRLPSTYEPTDLVLVDSIYAFDGSQNYLRKESYDALRELIQAANTDGIQLNISNCYRSFETQKQIYSRYIESYSQELVDTFSARPGHSQHQLGTTCDFGSGQQQLTDFTGTDAQLWLELNAHEYGFILSYPEGREDETGYMYESWHYRYVGKNIASHIYDENIVFEIYYNQYLK